jgi:hypothetical protein
MTMKMEWVLASVIVVQDDFNDLAVLKDKSICIATVYYGI